MLPPTLRAVVRLASVAVAASLFCASAPRSLAEIPVKPGDKVAFLGDSITAQGWSNPAGYVKLIVAAFDANGIKIDPVPAGISGHKSNDMLARVERDVLNKKPQWMTLSCGVNDVWHGVKGVPLDDAQAAAQTYQKRNEMEPPKGTYEKNITEIVDKALHAGVQVVILTSTPIKEENLGNDENKKLAAYNDFLRKLAKEKHLPLADLNAMFQERIKAANKPGQKIFTVDGVHMNTEGNKVMATGVLQAFGFNAEQLKKAETAWVPLEAQAAENAKKAAEAKAKADAAKAAARAAAAAAPAK